jgi:uncharacterized protein (UPF0332 family)
MDPRQFLEVAAFLTGEATAAPEEARYRSAVGRSYYGLYNVITAELAALGFSLKFDPSSHTKAYRYLTQTKVAHALEAGKILDSLREERNKADYNMGGGGFTQAQAQSANKRARAALESFAKVDRQALKKAIEEYRRMVGE